MVLQRLMIQWIEGECMDWDKRDDETDKSYEWFCRYLDMGPERSLVKVGQKYGKNKSYVNQLWKWSSKYEWVDRAMAYDEYIQGLKREKKQDRILQTAEEHIDLADNLMEMLLRKMAALECVDMKPLEWKQIAEFAVKTKRDALGIAEKHEVSGEINVEHTIGEKLSKDLLERSKKLLEEFENDES